MFNNELKYFWIFNNNKKDIQIDIENVIDVFASKNRYIVLK